MKVISHSEPPQPDPRRKQRGPTPADLVRERVAELAAMGQARGWGRIVSDKYVEGVGIVLVFENGTKVTTALPRGSQTRP